MRTGFCLATVLTLIAFSFFSASAQSATATLSGLVTDQNSARVPAARVAVTNTSTGLAQSVTSNGEGYFAFNFLPPGPYTLSVQREGFAKVEVREFVLAVNDRRAMKIQLKVGTISETVTVEGASVVQTDSVAVSTLIDRNFVSNLPLNGRSFHSLVALVPGVVLTKTDTENQGQFSVNGQRADSNNFTVDGVSANFGINSVVDSSGSLPASNALGGVSSLVSVDALEEFSVQTSTYAAEFGRFSGGQISVITRSGTNDYHGNVFEYFRNEALDANDWFGNQAGLPRAPLRQNDFGGVLGGPIVPKKTFFFFSYEALRLRQPRVAATSVPSVEIRQQVPQPMQQLFNALPIPNAESFPGFAAFRASYSDPSTVNATSLRLDHKISDAFSVFGRFNIAPSESLNRRQDGPSVVNESKYNTKTFTFGTTNAAGPTIQNEFRVNYSTSDRYLSSYVDDFGGAVVPPDSVLFPSSIAPGTARFRFDYEGGGSLVVGQTENHQRQINIIDNLSVIHNNHQLKFGVDYRKLLPVISPQPYFQSVVTKRDLAPLGLASTIQITSRLGEIFPRYTNLSVYGQDTWKVTPRLTINYGLRWELDPSPSEENGNMPYSLMGLEDPSTISLGPLATKLWKTGYADFAPRVGISYLANASSGRETLIKGGVGVFYDLGMQMAGASLGGEGFPYSSIKQFFEVPWPLSAVDAAPRPPSLDPPYPYIGIMDPHLKMPRTYQWSAGLTQGLGRNQALTLTYVGAAGRRLKSSHSWVNPNPRFTYVEIVGNKGFSDYNSFQAQFQRRLSRNFQALVSYTWSHSIDTASNDFFERTFTNDRILLTDDRGSSDFDVRHSLSAAVAYEIPRFVPGKLSSWIMRDWAVDATLFTRTATPMNAYASSHFGYFRADLNPGVPIYISDSNSPGGWHLNSEAFSVPTAFRQGTLGRNVLRGFPVFQVDLSLRRTFKITERVRAKLMADAFNILNHPNFADPNNLLFGIPELDPWFFGHASQMLNNSMGIQTSAGTTGFNEIYQIGGSRSVQLALKLEF